ncbi:putative ABC transporter, AAA+ ATPase domain, FeS cluster assembly SUF system, ATPase SufC [Dioscorea sansibarensis]
MALMFSSPAPRFAISPSLPPTSPWNSFLITVPTPHRRRRCLRGGVRAAVAVDFPSAEGGGLPAEIPNVFLEVNDLRAVIKGTDKEILKGVNLTINEGEIHTIMGRNGSGKSTFAKVLVGHPDYEVTKGDIVFKGENLLDMDPEERSLAGLFMSFQSPVEIPGVSNMDFLCMAYNARRKTEISPIEFFHFLLPKLEAVKMDPRFLDRNVNEGFSGGEKKRNEILQLAVLEADLAILDEIDSGLDVDALQDVAKALVGLMTPKNSILMITHYPTLLDLINKPGFVHIMQDGVIKKTGDRSLAKLVEKGGYGEISNA